MKSLRIATCAAVMLLSTFALAQSNVQQSFDEMKSMAGEWEGKVTVEPPMPQMSNGRDEPTHVSLRVTSRGHALVHEMQSAGTPLDATKYDHPVTMIYIDGDHLNLVHYCDAGNRPQMVANVLDGKTTAFEMVELSGSDKNGHMQHVAFARIDANHHTEDWVYMMPGNKAIHAHFDLHRVK